MGGKKQQPANRCTTKQAQQCILHSPKPSRAASVAVHHDDGILDDAVLAKIVAELFLGDLRGQSAHKNLAGFGSIHSEHI